MFAQSNDEIISDEALESWLNEYSKLKSDSSGLVATVDTVINSIVVIEPDSTLIVEETAVDLDFNKIVTPKELITEADLLELHKKGILNSVYNPLFLDWVFNAKTPSRGNGMTEEDSILNGLRNQARSFILATSPELFTYHSDNLPDISEIKSGKIGNVSKEELLLSVSDGLTVPNNEKIVIEQPKPKFWSYGAQFQAQVSQAYISSNWYNGGESNLNSFFMVKAFANYNDTKRIQWENNVEWKLGFITAGEDSLRMFRTNEDQFKINTKFGVKAFGTFFYTLEGELQTQFFNTFVPNTYIRSTAAFSPIRTYLSIGMDYKYKDDLSVFVSPVSYKMVFVADTTVFKGVSPDENIARKVGIEPGKNTLNQLGGLLRVNYKHKFNDDINLETNFSFYANYVGEKKGVEISWEVIGNFVINRFFSCRISLHPRYDTTIVLPEGEKNRLQFKELISIGFNYKI